MNKLFATVAAAALLSASAAFAVDINSPMSAPAGDVSAPAAPAQMGGDNMGDHMGHHGMKKHHGKKHVKKHHVKKAASTKAAKATPGTNTTETK